jgi:hypothetical protein
VVRRICFESEGFEGGELVDGRNDGLLLKGRDWDIVGGRCSDWCYRGL